MLDGGFDRARDGDAGLSDPLDDGAHKTELILREGAGLWFREETAGRSGPADKSKLTQQAALRKASIFASGGNGALGEVELQKTQRKRAAGGDKSPDVVAKARARAAQSQRKQFRQINGKPGEQGELEKPHDRQQHKNLPGLRQKLEGDDRAEKRAHRRRRRRLFSVRN